MIYLYSFIHAFFCLLGIFAWFSIDHKRDYRKNIKLSLLVGIPLGLFVDFSFSAFGNFWSYSSKNIFEYIVILLSTYVVGTAVIVEVTEYCIKNLKLFKAKGIKTLSSDFYYSEILIGFLLICLLAIHRLINILNGEELIFFVLGYLSLIILSDGILGIHYEEGVVTRFLKGYFLAPIGLILGGLIVGVIWEFLNVNLRLWTYTNIPTNSILEIPLVVLCFWGVLSIIYWTTAKVVSKYIKL